jgi:hypothetical protein
VSFDLPVALHKKWLRASGDLPFLRSTPSKVVMSVSGAIGDSLALVADDLSTVSIMDDRGELPLSLPAGPVSLAGISVKAAKADDAEAEIALWDAEVLVLFPKLKSLSKEGLGRACEDLRNGQMRWWKRSMTMEVREYLYLKYGIDWKTTTSTENPELGRDRATIGEVLKRVYACTYWDWKWGSTLFFWRWTPAFQTRARDGVKVYLQGKLPRYRRHQPEPRDETKTEQVRKKLAKVRDRNYIERGPVLSLTGYFDVPKTLFDIRMVYDASKCKLNEAVWAPNFFMPSPDSLYNTLDSGTFMGDIDLGEFFLNFPLDISIRPYAGVDLTPYFGSKAKLMWERWGRCLMGFTPSPYNTAQSMGWAEEIIRGNPCDMMLPFHWVLVEFNLPGSVAYDPSRPWVSKRRSDGDIAADMVSYCDDLRTCGPSREAALFATKRVASVCNYLGIQDAPRKRRFPSRFPGAWAGTMAFTSDAGVFGTVSQERWDKAKGIISSLWDGMVNRGGRYEHSKLLSDRGFLLYVGRTYPTMRPYLKGLNLTIDRWRPGRDVEGWKDMDWCDDYLTLDEEGNDGEAPPFVNAVPRFRWDLAALKVLFEADVPAVRTIRPSSRIDVRYGFGDASGSGFGGSIALPGGISYRIGVWGSDSEGSSSNYRELRNLVETLEAEVEAGNLKNCEMFMMTDNSTAEACFYRGSSRTEKLFELVLRLHKLEMTAGMVLHIIHVAGTRMIAQGTDGLSRGDLLEGVMKGEDFLSFVPLHLSALDRSPDLEGWFRGMYPHGTLETLDPCDWFQKGHDIRSWYKNNKGFWYPVLEEGVYLWHPPPAAAHVAVEELRKARLKRQDSTHIFVCPRLMAPYWRRQLHKVADLVFEIPCNALPEWAATNHEPLVVGIVYPFVPHRPWQLRNTPKFRAVARELRSLWKESPGDARPFLRQLRLFSWSLSTMSKGMVWSLLQAEDPGLVLHKRARR